MFDLNHNPLLRYFLFGFLKNMWTSSFLESLHWAIMESFNSILDSPSNRFLHFVTTTSTSTTSTTIPAPATKRRLSSSDETNRSQLKKRVKTDPRTEGEDTASKQPKKIDSKDSKDSKDSEDKAKVSGKMATNSKTRTNPVWPPWKPWWFYFVNNWINDLFLAPYKNWVHLFSLL